MADGHGGEGKHAYETVTKLQAGANLTLCPIRVLDPTGGACPVFKSLHKCGWPYQGHFCLLSSLFIRVLGPTVGGGGGRLQLFSSLFKSVSEPGIGQAPTACETGIFRWLSIALLRKLLQRDSLQEVK